MGTGFYGIPLDLSASIMLDEFSEFLSDSKSIKEVIICTNDNREYRVFEQKWNNI